VTSSVAKFEAATSVKLIYMTKSSLKTRQNEKIWKSKNFFT